MYGIEFMRYLAPPPTLLQIRSRYFCAGVVLDEHGRVLRVAPILRNHIMQGWSEWRVRGYAKNRKWTVEAI